MQEILVFVLKSRHLGRSAAAATAARTATCRRGRSAGAGWLHIRDDLVAITDTMKARIHKRKLEKAKLGFRKVGR